MHNFCFAFPFQKCTSTNLWKEEKCFNLAISTSRSRREVTQSGLAKGLLHHTEVMQKVKSMNNLLDVDIKLAIKYMDCSIVNLGYVTYRILKEFMARQSLSWTTSWWISGLLRTCEDGRWKKNRPAERHAKKNPYLYGRSRGGQWAGLWRNYSAVLMMMIC